MESLAFLKTISNATKLRIIALLLEEDLCVCEMEEILSIKQVNISKNLNRLKEAGIVDVRRVRPRAFYFLTDAFLSHDYLVNHLKEIILTEPQLQEDYKTYLKHRNHKEDKLYVCNVFKDEVS
jgi:ArsR family transcriptional regulator